MPGRPTTTRKPNSPDKPTPKKRAGRPRRTDWQDKFLARFTEHGVQAWACKEIGISPDTVIEERKRNPDFAHRYDNAFEESTCRLERRLVEWAADGIKTIKTVTRTETKTDKDGKTTTHTVTTVTEGVDMSEACLIFALKARRPMIYRDRLSVEQTGTEGGPVELRITSEEKDAAVERFGAEVVRLVDARRAREGDPASSTG